jgi:hypothetical protein
MRTLEVDGRLEEFSADGAGEMVKQFGELVNSDLNMLRFPLGEKIEHF